MTDFLLELRSEEIPARMQGKAKEDLARLFNDALAKAGLAAGSVEAFATPRRVALIATGLPLATEAVAEETKGPKVGAPPQAMEGFLRKTGLTQDQLVERDGVYFAVVEKAGRQTADVLGEAIPAIIRAFPWPKSQRWGAASVSTESLRWVRPLQGIVALLGDEVVPCQIDGIVSGAATMGDRFHHKGPITIGNAGDYIEKLRACHVIVHFSERCAIIRDGAKAAAEAAGLTLVEDEGLVAENAGLTEWPVPMLGRFDPAFLEVPQEVIQLTARVNQKYFVCQSPSRLREGLGEGASPTLTDPPPAPPASGRGALANAFVCTANIVANDGGAAIVAGNEKVLAARLSDAKFFWEQDLKIALDDQAKKLSQITFHEKLGTVADKVERVAKLARWLVTECIVTPQTAVAPAQAGAHHAPQSGTTGEIGSSLRWSDEEVEALAVQAERAARLCKADLVTGMVGEFPELQAIMGGYYARAQGESDAVADAIRDHYKPVGQGDDVPTAPVTVAVSLADKLDTLASFFAIDEKPTGSKDPFALRRAAIGIVSLIRVNGLRLDLIMAAFQIVAPQALQRDLEQDDSLFKDLRNLVPKVYGPEDSVEVLTKAAVTLSERNRKFKPEPFKAAIRSCAAVRDFVIDRLAQEQKDSGIRHDIIQGAKQWENSVGVGAEIDLVRLLARVKALQAFVATDEGVNLLAGYKRAANILKQSSPTGEGDHAKHGGGAPAESPDFEGGHSLDVPLHQPAAGPPPRAGEELALLTALDIAEPKAAAAVDAEDFEGAMAALASLRAPIDAFFDGVMVNDPDPQKRAFRLGLLARFRDAVHRVADFSKIEG